MNAVETRRTGRLYGTFWRWHFYAGLLVAPFLVILSLTGMIYLFNDELNDRIYPELRFASSMEASQPVSHFLQAVEAAYPESKTTRLYLPTAAGRTAELFVTTAEGKNLRVFIDPPTAHVLGAYVYTHTLVGFADVMHGSLLLGDFGNAIMELVACWTLVMIATGLYLWFPRREHAGTWWPRKGLMDRLRWKDWHKITGLYAAVFILFLLISGLPWTSIWGGKVLQPVSAKLGISYPPGARRPLTSDSSSHHHDDLPWTLRQAPTVISGSNDKAPISIDKAVSIFAEHGMNTAYRLFPPNGKNGVYMAYTYPDQPEGQRTIQLDQYSGKILADVSFRDYGPVAKLVELGVALHMGNDFGLANQLVMLFPCIAILVMIITGVMMWWKRKPVHALGAPPVPETIRLPKSLIIAMLIAGALFPLFGASLLVIWLGDKAFSKIIARHG